jgi:WD40 repeat protein
VAFSADGHTLASGSDEPTVRLWDVQSHKELVTPLAAHNGAVNSVAFSPDGRTLASASTDGTLRLWNRLLWRNLAELQNEVCSLAVSGLSKAEWEQYAAGVPYRNSCP